MGAEIIPVIDLILGHMTPTVTLIAIDGHSAAGKTSLAKEIEASFADVQIVHMDDFYRVMDNEERERLDAAGGYELYYDWQRLGREVLQPLSQEQQSYYHRYDWAKNELSEEKLTLQPFGVIIVEGCYSARPELRNYYHARVLVETPVQKRLERQRKRANASQAWLEKWDAAERYYLETLNAKAFADLIVQGSQKQAV
jgi:uridine kinase